MRVKNSNTILSHAAPHSNNDIMILGLQMTLFSSINVQPALSILSMSARSSRGGYFAMKASPQIPPSGQWTVSRNDELG